MWDELKRVQKAMQGSGIDLNIKLTPLYACYEDGEYVGVWPGDDLVGNSKRFLGRQWYVWSSRNGQPAGVDAHHARFDLALRRFREKFVTTGGWRGQVPQNRPSP